jgi:MSHA biogenesis protein MshK
VEKMNKYMIASAVLLIATMAQADAGLPDPTRPADYSVTRTIKQITPKQRTEFSVNAIRISEFDRSAIINGRLLRVGNEIGTAKIREINATEVVLEYERKLLTVPLYSQSISKQFKTPKNEE